MYTLTRGDIANLIAMDRATEFGDVAGWEDDINRAFEMLAGRRTQAVALRMVAQWATMGQKQRADAWHASTSR